ncbi:MAG TPA: hypothetical protein VF173_13120 [Thermoanaerobaculia bacterium]|nr:hypothetical protein [Thermoanaerobaculia bacterium]
MKKSVGLFVLIALCALVPCAFAAETAPAPSPVAVPGAPSPAVAPAAASAPAAQPGELPSWLTEKPLTVQPEPVFMSCGTFCRDVCLRNGETCCTPCACC